MKRHETASEQSQASNLTSILQKLYTRMTRQEAALKGISIDVAEFRSVIVNHISAIHLRLDEIASKIKKNS